MELLIDSLLPSKKENILWEFTEDNDIFKKYTQYFEEKKVVKEQKNVNNVSILNMIENKKDEDVKQKHKSSNKKIKPIEIIIRLSDNNIVNEDNIKKLLIEFISNKNFATVFGLKKTAEMMSGITENKWNKSLVIFLSFLFDVSFVYLKKPVQYDSEKQYDNIINI